MSDALECLQHRDERPFFLWLSFPEPHNPYQVPEPYFSLFPPDDIPDRLAGPDAVGDKGPKWRWERRLLLDKWPDTEDDLPGGNYTPNRGTQLVCGVCRSHLNSVV